MYEREIEKNILTLLIYFQLVFLIYLKEIVYTHSIKKKKKMLRRNSFWMQEQCLLSGIYNRNNKKMFYIATRKSAHLKIAKLIETNDGITLNNVSQALSDRQTEQITIGMF